MERPFYNKVNTSGNYVSAKMGSGRNYKEGDKNFLGELSVHKSWVSEWLYGSVGVYGQTGKYSLKDSASLNFHSFGMRLDGGVSIYSGNTEVSLLALSVSRSYENGAFYNFRNNSKLNYFFIYYDSLRVSPREKWTTDVQPYMNIRHKIAENKVIGVRYGLGFSFNNEMAVYPFIDASYQFHKRLHVNFSYIPIIATEKNGVRTNLKDLLSVGITYGF